MLFELICAVVAYFYTEHMQIIMSNENIVQYKDKCNKTYQWLKEHDVFEKQDIQNYRDRLVKYIEKNETSNMARKQRLDKWMQILLIPVVLAVFSAFIKDQTDMNAIMGYALGFVFIIIVVYGLVLGLSNVTQIFYKRQLNQVQMFVNDLQGVLDTQF